jgi:photosystem II stability/assembly factor-like uncharacterized protein
MFQLASPIYARKLGLALALAALLACAGAGGAAWYFTRCHRDDYLSQVKVFLPNPQEQYLFACGRIWRTINGGRSWTRPPMRGLPFGVRTAQIAVDRKPGLLYLGVVAHTRLSFNCLQCTWIRVQPAIYVSHNGGMDWQLAREFNFGPGGQTLFMAVHADPDYENAAWAILKRGDDVAYYATNNGGRTWQKTCSEDDFPNLRCDPPDELLRFQHDRSQRGKDGP